MKTVKTLNKWVIKKKKDEEVVCEGRHYGVFTPDGRFMEDNLTFQEAVEFAEENGEEFVSKPRKAKFNKEEFIEFVGNGVWFRDKIFPDYVFLKNDNGNIQSLRLTIYDPESMCFEVIERNKWGWDYDKQAIVYEAVNSTYYFASSMQDREDIFIYNKDLEIVESKLFDVLFNSNENESIGIFKSIEHVESIWSEIKKDTLSDRVLEFVEK